MFSATPGKKLRDLFASKNTVLSMCQAPNALHARIMESAGIKAFFVGGGKAAGNYTGYPNTSVATMTELVMIGGYVARAINAPVLLDGDAGPGSLSALEKMVEDCIRAGLAGVRFEDQPSGKKRQAEGKIDLITREEAVARFRVAVEVRDRLDPTFVIGAKTYAREANNGGVKEGIERLNLYREAGCDTVHYQSPHTVEEVRQVRAAVKGVLAVILGPQMSLELHREIGVNIAWFTAEFDDAAQVACLELCEAFKKDGVAGLERFQKEHAETLAKLKKLDPLGSKREKELEEKYFGR